MSDIPASFELQTRKRADGKVDIVGKQDNGQEYVARTTQGSHVTSQDVDALAAGDRERTDSRQFTARFIEARNQRQQAFEAQTLGEFEEPAAELAHIVTRSKERTVGMGEAYERGARYFGIPLNEYIQLTQGEL